MMNAKTISLFFSLLLLTTLIAIPIQANNDNNAVITIKGGIGVTISIENIQTDNAISCNFSIRWTTFFNKNLSNTNGDGIIPPKSQYTYGERPTKLFSKVRVHVESEGQTVEREGFGILIFVFLKPSIE